MGIVYRAHDTVRSEDVALKTLLDADAEAIARIKREFRALSGIRHENLVLLHDLEVFAGRWFFTMELLRGRHLFEGPASAESSPDGRLPPQLVEELLQLAKGIDALHRADRLHRDLKPSNVMVTESGRVVLLDFGLAVHRRPGPGSSREVDVDDLRGTAAYIAPEELLGRPPSTATDWYSFGVILFRALTGRLPFVGATGEVLAAKVQRPAPSPRELAPHAPPDLDALCAGLLRREPRSRPRSDEILQALGGSGAPAGGPPAIQHRPVFVGRKPELTALRASLTQASAGHTVLVRLQGSSGMGKSTLLHHFLEEVERTTDAIVFQGRCYERESLPYKAFDGIVDELGAHLRWLDDGALPRLAEEDARTLVRLFPALRWLAPERGSPAADALVSDGQELRRRAFGALREALMRVADGRLLVLSIDDVQWSDVDSAALLAHLLSTPSPARTLFLLACRTEEAQGTPLFEAIESAAPAIDVRTVELEPMSTTEARELFRALVVAPGADTSLDALAAECKGSPFFAVELARHIADRGIPAPRSLQLGDVLAQRIAALDAEPRRLLDTLAIASRPLPEAIAVAASGLTGRAQPAISSLRMACLVRSRGAGDAIALETYHDRIREAVLARMTRDEQVSSHQHIAEALVESSRCDPQALAVHYEAAGRRDLLGIHAAAAAREAGHALAFHRAVNLFRLALDAGPPDPPADLLEEFGVALLNSGRGAEGARMLLRAAQALERASADEGRVSQLKRVAAEHFLRSGSVSEGLRTVEEVLASVGARLPSSPLEAIAMVIAHRARLHLQGRKIVLHHSGRTIDPAVRAQLEAYWATGLGLSMVDTIASSDFQARHQLLAFRAGDPTNIARALASEAAFIASEEGSPSRERTAAMLDTAAMLGDSLGNPSVSALVVLCRGVAAYFQADFHAALSHCRTAEDMARTRCVGATWETHNAQIYALWAMTYLGRIGELVAALPNVIRLARERGDVFAVTSLRLGMPNLLWLALDRPEDAREQAMDAMAAWTRPTTVSERDDRSPRSGIGRGFHSQHYFAFVAQLHIDLYGGNGHAAWERARMTWPALERSLLLRLPSIRIELLHLRARAALMAAALEERDGRHAGDARRRLCRAALSDATTIASARTLHAAPMSWLIRAGVAQAERRTADAIGELARARRALREVGMELHAWAAEYAEGVLTGGDGGREMTARAVAWMRSQRIERPDRMTMVLVPGFLSPGT